MAKYKDYPVYTYDEPATYSDFSGGINTDPSNEHLQPNEMRDCLNMHYSSAALVKRKGASLLCNIRCEDELFNVQGVFLFTYRVTYIIIAADGKLYKGFYSPNATITLTRLPISIEYVDTLDAYNPGNIAVGLPTSIQENINQKHDGFIYSYVIDPVNNTKINLEKYLIGDYINLPDNTIIKDQDVVKYNNKYYKLNWVNMNTPENNRYLTRTLITPKNSSYWISLDDYNTKYSKEIEERSDILSISYGWKIGTHTGLVLDTKENKWKRSGYYYGETWIPNGSPGSWIERYIPWQYSCAVTYEGNIYICTQQHSNYSFAPDSSYATAGAEWVPLIETKELLFQNHSKIEAATYNNKLYLTTGTRFVVIELVSNKLIASVIKPYSCNTTEVTNIGYNYLSPYPELCSSTQYNQVITSIGGILPIKSIYGRYTLTPQMNFAQGETEHDYYFKWEKKIGDEWYTLYSYKDNTYETKIFSYIEDPNGSYIKKDEDFFPIINSLEGWDLYIREEENDGTYIYTMDAKGDYIRLHDPIEDKFKYYKAAFVTSVLEEITDTTIKYKRAITGTQTHKLNLFTIEVDDADRYQYRVSFAKSFEIPTEIAENWSYTHPYNIGDKVSVQLDASGVSETYICVKAHDPRKVLWDNCEYKKTDKIFSRDKSGYYYEDFAKDLQGNYINLTTTPIFSTTTSTRTGKALYERHGEDFKFICYDTSTIIHGNTYWEKEYTEEPILTESGVKYDWIVNKVDGEYFGQGSSVLATDLTPEDTFLKIHSCKKITSDGNKFLLYDDKYNSGSWYKTIIDNPTYITHRGGLSFKTTKNESLIKVIPFNGTLIAFANAENVGGSIHMVTGNGDDWDDQSGYYSPYRRTTINVNVSCDNADTVQVCENILIFKYFDTLYYISGSELNNEVVSVYSCNDKIKHNNNFVRVPWDDNTCISEVTEDYYALIWKERYVIENEDLILDRPAIKIKMYYKLGKQFNEKIVYPWLRDESEYFNIDHILYIKGKPIYLYNNTLITFNTPTYTDFDTIYTCLVHFRGEDLNYPKMTKLISNVLVYYHRNQYSTIDFDLVIKNEAGHLLLDSCDKKISLQDLRALRSGDTLIDGSVRLDSTILDSKVFNTSYKFPCLLADATIVASNNKEFSISSITYNYITSEMPDQTIYDLYSNILRPKEVT